MPCMDGGVRIPAFLVCFVLGGNMHFYGLLNLSWWAYIVVTLVLTHITMICVTIYLHRAQAHRALDLHPIVAHFFRFWLWLTTGMKTREWVSVHRKHHARCETVEDPHSPIVEGIWTVLFQGAELYRYAKKDEKTIARYSKGTPNDWVERFVYSAHFLRGKIGVILMLLIDLLLLGVPGLIVWGIQMAWTPFFAAGVVNGVGHYWGYRNYECGDAARNIVPWGILIAGEELHNNHHTYGNAAKLSVHWWEFDIGWMYIKLLSYLGLAKPKRLPAKVCDLPQPAVDLITLSTIEPIVNNKVAVFSAYTRQVLKPVFEQLKKEKSRSNPLFSMRLKTLVLRNPAILSQQELDEVSLTLKEATDLEKAYVYRNRLNEIWSDTSHSNDALVAAFQAWCDEAEKSRIAKLEDFAHYLKTYRLKA